MHKQRSEWIETTPKLNVLFVKITSHLRSLAKFVYLFVYIYTVLGVNRYAPSGDSRKCVSKDVNFLASWSVLSLV